MRISYYTAHSRQRGYLFRSALGVASGDHDLATGIFAMDAANGGAGILIRGGGHGAGVENDDLRLGGNAGAVESALSELSFDGGSVGLGGAAAKVLYVEGTHRTIVTE